MKYTIKDTGGEVVKEDDRYVVKDNKMLNNLVVSSTQLNPNKQTSGHNHKGQEEVYFFVEGTGTMWLDEKEMSVKKGDVVLIEDGVFHKVKAGNDGLYFVCVFDGRRNH
jgi:mannose-6-phosphate isomerase-like protein (cupin superfamily)|tara:strand:- start:2409 stop:2735 length:327 start_codon:yes stop_codon:yes gene_type:complete